MQFTAILRRGDKQYVALCPEVDVVSQGHAIEEALRNLREAVELFIEEMGMPEDLKDNELIITHFGVKDAKTTSSVRA